MDRYQRLKKIFRILLIFGIVFSLPALSPAIRIEDPETETDLLLMGLGVLRVNYTSLKGNPIIFENSDRGLPDYFSNSTKIDFLASGTFYHGYELEGYVHYRDITYDFEPNLDFFLKIKRDNNYLSIGDHKDGMFTDTLFTRFEPDFRGGTVHLEGKNYGAELFGGAVRGNQAEDEIPGDGTSGPYYVTHFPVMVGSETVLIRVRDKNTNRIIKNDRQQRGIDYTIDFDTGKLKFTYPVETTDFSGNPISIVVDYQYDDPSGGFSRYVMGGRFWVMPQEYVKMGLTYLTEGPVGDTIGGSWDQRMQIYGTDILIDNKNNFFLNAEFAAGDSPASGDAKSYAYRGNFEWKATPDLRLWGGYFRVDRDFPTFGTTSYDVEKVVREIRYDTPFDFESGTDIYDLNPDIDTGLGTDEESWGLAGEYRLGENHVLTAGYREIKDNVPMDATVPRSTTRDVFMSYRYTPADRFNYFVGAQWLRSFDNMALKGTDSETYRVIMGAKGPLGSTHITGPVRLEAAYIYDDFRDYVSDSESRKTNYLLARMDIEPVPDLRFFIEQDEVFATGGDTGGLIHRGDATWLGADYKRNRFRAEVIYKFLTEQDYTLDREVTREHRISTIFRYQPTDTISVGMTFEVGAKDDAESLPSTTTVNYLADAEIAWDIRPDLVLSVGYTLQSNDQETTPGVDDTLDDEAVVRLEYSPDAGNLALYGEYRFERSFLKDYPLSSDETRTNTYILGGTYHFYRNWELTGGYKYAGTTGALLSHKMDAFTEVGYDIFDYLKLSLGYEHQELLDRDAPDTNYNADIGYLKLTGKF